MRPDGSEETARLPIARWRPWADIVGAAGLGFLWLLAVGALLLVAAKLDFPALGAHSNPIDVLIAIVMFGLATLKVPIGLSRLSISVLPLGALVAFGWGLSTATRQVVARVMPTDLRARAVYGARAAIPFAVMCWAAALIFRFRMGPNPLSANAGAALVAGAIWGALFGALGGLRSSGSIRTLVASGIGWIQKRASWVGSGVIAGVWMTALATVLATGAVLLWIIAGLAHGRPESFGVSDAGAALVYLIAFFPNVVVAVVSIALGASVTAGARVMFGAKTLGLVRTYSYLGWGHRPTPWFVFLLIAIPLLSCMAGGWTLRAYGVTRDHAPEAVGVAALTFAVPLAVLSSIGAARLGAGLLQPRGVGSVSAVAWQVLLAALGWAILAGLAGWLVADRFGSKKRRAP